MAVDREKGDPSADPEDDQECDRAGNEMRRWELVDENRLQWACCIGQSLQSITRTWPSDDEGGNAGGGGPAISQSASSPCPQSPPGRAGPKPCLGFGAPTLARESCRR